MEQQCTVTHNCVEASLLLSVDLDSWQSKIDSHDVSTSAPVQPSGSGDGAVDAVATTTTVDTSTSADGGYGTFERYRDGIVTIGCIGKDEFDGASFDEGLQSRSLTAKFNVATTALCTNCLS